MMILEISAEHSEEHTFNTLYYSIEDMKFCTYYPMRLNASLS